MNSEFKGLVLWLTYASALIVAFFGVRLTRSPNPETVVAPPPIVVAPPPTVAVAPPVPETRPAETIDKGMPESPPTYTVTLIPPGDFQFKDARRNEELAVVFQLDKAPTDASITVGYRIKGNAREADFEVTNLSKDGRIRFEPGQGGSARLFLRRLPGPRGLGNRKILVECMPDPGGRVTLAQGGLSSVEVVIPDPESRLKWDDGPPVFTSKPDGSTRARLSASLAPPCSVEVKFHYVMRVDGEIVAERSELVTIKPLSDPWALEASGVVVDQEIPPPRPVFLERDPDTRGRKVRIEPDPESSRELGPNVFTAPSAAPRALSGSVLVILLLTDKLTDVNLREIESTLEKPEAKPLRDRLVNRTVFLLDAEKKLAPLDATTFQQKLKPFPKDATIDVMLGDWSKKLIVKLNERLTGKKRTEKRALLVHDVGIKYPNAIGGGLVGKDWTIFLWITPSPVPLVESELKQAIKDNGSRLQVVGSDFPKRLLEFLKD